MRGVSYLVDDAGKKTAVILDLRKHRRLWEDIYHRMLIDARRHGQREAMMVRTIKRGRPAGAAANARRVLGELILTTLARSGGHARASAVLRSVRDAAEPYVPADWKKPHPPYRSRVEWYTAFERATLRDLGLLDPRERGIWKLTPLGWDKARKLLAAWDSGTAEPKLPVEQLAWQGRPNWLGRVAGSLRDEPDFEQVLRLGRQARRADRPRKA